MRIIGLDTNILLRAIANDDPEQSPKARLLLSSFTPEAPGLLNPVVMAEVSWVLRVRYKRTHAEVLARLEALMRSPAYLVLWREAVNNALVRCREYNLEFSDAIIGELNLMEGAKVTVTFDVAAAQTPAFERLT
jgi:predicted nucleic-acid-binding protein